MSTLVPFSRCPGCSGAFIDLGDEFVCNSCGMVAEKEVVEAPSARAISAMDFTRQALGGYLGTIDGTEGERHSKGISGSPSTYGYLKVISDFAGRDEDLEYSCARMIERVCEKLSLPEFVMVESVSIMKKTLPMKGKGHRITSAALSAYSIATACKVEGVTSVTLREIVDSHRDMGRRVKMSAIMKLTLDSPLKPPVRRPQDYLARVLGRLANHPQVAAKLKADGVKETPYFNALREEACKLLKEVELHNIEGHGPCALAASSVYAAEVRLSSNEGRRRRITQREAADCGDTAEYTIRDQFREILIPVLLSSGQGEVLLPTPLQ